MKEEGWSKDFDDGNENDKVDEELDAALSATRAWMEIVSVGSTQSGSLQVGEMASLAIKCTLPGKDKKDAN